jgi:protein required for attachment to host cells
MKLPKRLYVIADGGRARFVAMDDAGDFHTLSSFVSSEMHQRTSDLGRDRPSRVKESANPSRHAVEPKHDLHDAVKEDFVRQVAAAVDQEHSERKFDDLILVAPPRVLGELRASLSKAMAKAVVKELQKDLTKVADHELRSHLILPA